MVILSEGKDLLRLDRSNRVRNPPALNAVRNG